MKTLRERFDAKWEPEPMSGCWLWTACRDDEGYGRIGGNWSGGRPYQAHRLSYELHVGPIPVGLNVLHSCDTPACVNPAHLRVGTQLDNIREAISKGRALVGEKNGHARLTSEHVADIRRRVADGEMQKVLAVEYGVSRPHVSMIVSGEKRKVA